MPKCGHGQSPPPVAARVSRTRTFHLHSGSNAIELDRVFHRQSLTKKVREPLTDRRYVHGSRSLRSRARGSSVEELLLAEFSNRQPRARPCRTLFVDLHSSDLLSDDERSSMISAIHLTRVLGPIGTLMNFDQAR